MTDFYMLPNGRTTGFYLGERGTVAQVDEAVRRWHERKSREAAEAAAMRAPAENIPDE